MRAEKRRKTRDRKEMKECNQIEEHAGPNFIRFLFISSGQSITR